MGKDGERPEWMGEQDPVLSVNAEGAEGVFSKDFSVTALLDNIQ